MVRRGKSKEEVVAQKIVKELSDFTLDLDSVGEYLASAAPYVIFRRAMEVFEACEYRKEGVEYRKMGEHNERLF